MDEEEDHALETGKQPRRVNVAQLIRDSSGTIFWHNICFCIYFFFLIGCFVYNYSWGTPTFSGAGCDTDSWGNTVVIVGCTYPILVFVYTVMWRIFLRMHNCLENVLKPCGGFTCCFGRAPPSRAAAGSVQMAGPAVQAGGVAYQCVPLQNGAPVQAIIVDPHQAQRGARRW